MTCPGCGGELASESRFCIHCGTQLAAANPATAMGSTCPVCGGEGTNLPSTSVYCTYCRWLRPLGPGYELPIDVFLWRLDADAMNVLQSLGPVTAAAHALSDRVGRPWLEASVNGLRLSERQLPEVFALAIKAARIMGLPYLPEIYISGDQMWDAVTLGSDESAFVVIGSVLTNFKEDELLFVLGREMGHCRAGHALWKTLTHFMAGRSPRRTIMGEGVLKLLNPAKMVESAIDAPLMAWARHAEITADTAGLLVVRNEEIARRVLQGWTFRSFPLLQRINPEAWLEQEQDSLDMTIQLSEWTLASAPYLAGRLRLLREFAHGEQYQGWRAVINHWLGDGAKPASPKGPGPRHPGPGADANTIRLVCASCQQPMRIPASSLAGKESINVRCPNPKCRAILTIRPRSPVPPSGGRPGDAAEAAATSTTD